MRSQFSRVVPKKLEKSWFCRYHIFNLIHKCFENDKYTMEPKSLELKRIYEQMKVICEYLQCPVHADMRTSRADIHNSTTFINTKQKYKLT